MADLGGIGAGPGAGLRFASRRGRTGDGRQSGVRYPSPFFDIGQTYLPTSIRNMFKWCRYYFLTNPLMNAVVTKMAQYPITGLSYDTKNEETKKRWEFILEERLDILAFLEGVGLDYYAYGNAFISLSFPFKKYLKCQSCKEIYQISKATYKFRDYQYLLQCDKCNTIGPAYVNDRHIRSLHGVQLLRWGPENIGIKYNPITGEKIYVYDMPQQMKNDILLGKPEIVERIPHVFVEAMRQNKAIEFSQENLFHLMRPHLAEQDQGWGLPLLMAGLKDAFYLQILKKAQEAIAEQRIVPLEVLFPQPSTSVGEPYGTTDLGNWAARVEEEIARWKFDPNHIPIMPLPIGHQIIGGDGRALLLHQEIRLWSEQIVIGMGVPIEFIFGGASWSGSNVSLRTIENMFLKYRHQQLRMVKWIVKKISLFMGWPGIDMHFTDFKMADDLQRKQLYLTLAQLNKVSDRTLMDEFDLDYTNERKQIEEQFRYDSEYQKQMMVAQAEAQGEAGLVSARYQQKMQEAQVGPATPEAQAAGGTGEPGQTGQGMDARRIAESYARKIAKMPAAERSKILAQMQQQYPNLAALVMQFLAGGQQGLGQGTQGDPTLQPPPAPAVPQQLSGSAMKPLPEVKPPRRTAASV